MIARSLFSGGVENVTDGRRLAVVTALMRLLSERGGRLQALAARRWRERAAEWRAIGTFVREATSRRMMNDAERARLLRELREAKRKYEAWMAR